MIYIIYIYPDTYSYFWGYILGLAVHSFKIEIVISKHASLSILPLSRETVFKENSRVVVEQ